MKAVVKGFAYVSYESKKTGEMNEGFEVHIQCAPPKNIEFTGVQCKNIWVSPVLMRNTVGMVEIDKEYDFDYDGSGKFPVLVDIVPVD